MGFKIRKSFKIAPGLRINLSKSGASVSVGKAGATVNVSRRGVKSTVGLPGTGLSHTQNLSANKTDDQKVGRVSNGIPGWVSLLVILLVIWVVAKLI